MTIKKYTITLELDNEKHETIEIEVDQQILKYGMENNNEGLWLFIKGYLRGLKGTK